jgi:hypothetical protein
MGLVYEVVHNDDNDIRYVGSTRCTLKERWCRMKAGYKRYTKGYGLEISIYKSFDEYDIENFTMKVLERAPGISKLALRKREQKWILILPCVNKYRAYRTKQQKEEQRKQYILRGKTPMVCTCGKELNWGSKYLHMKRSNHLRHEFNFLMME